MELMQCPRTTIDVINCSATHISDIKGISTSVINSVYLSTFLKPRSSLQRNQIAFRWMHDSHVKILNWKMVLCKMFNVPMVQLYYLFLVIYTC